MSVNKHSKVEKINEEKMLAILVVVYLVDTSFYGVFAAENNTTDTNKFGETITTPNSNITLEAVRDGYATVSIEAKGLTMDEGKTYYLYFSKTNNDVNINVDNIFLLDDVKQLLMIIRVSKMALFLIYILKVL